MNLKTDKILEVFLWLVAIHSFFVGIGLIVIPSPALEFLGFNLTFDRFFSSQGGVFHIVMSVCYTMAALNLRRYKELIVFSVIVKFIATIFLITYFIFVSRGWLIILSGISDFIMGLIILFLYRELNSKSFFAGSK